MASQDGQEDSSSSRGRNPLPRRPRGGARARLAASATAGAGAGAGASSSSTAAANPAAGASATAGAGAGVPAPGASAGSNTGTATSSNLTAAANPVAVGTGAGGGAGAGAAPPAASHANHGQVVRVGVDWKYECQCGARMANRAKNIGSHMSKKHNPNGRYEQLYAPFGNNIPCAEPGCDATFRHRYDIIHHYRRRHNHRGSGNPLLERYGFE